MRLIGDVLRELFMGCIIHGMVINSNDLIADLRVTRAIDIGDRKKETETN